MSTNPRTLAAIRAAIVELEAVQLHDGEAPSTARVLGLLRAEVESAQAARPVNHTHVGIHFEPDAEVDVRSFGSDGVRQYAAELAPGSLLYWRGLDDLEAFARGLLAYVEQERAADGAPPDPSALDLRLALHHLADEFARSAHERVAAERDRAISLLTSLSVHGSTLHRMAYRLAADALAAAVQRQGHEPPAALHEPTAEQVVARDRKEGRVA